MRFLYDYCRSCKIHLLGCQSRIILSFMVNTHKNQTKRVDNAGQIESEKLAKSLLMWALNWIKVTVQMEFSTEKLFAATQTLLYVYFINFFFRLFCISFSFYHAKWHPVIDTLPFCINRRFIRKCVCVYVNLNRKVAKRERERGIETMETNWGKHLKHIFGGDWIDGASGCDAS